MVKKFADEAAQIILSVGQTVKGLRILLLVELGPREASVALQHPIF